MNDETLRVLAIFVIIFGVLSTIAIILIMTIDFGEQTKVTMQGEGRDVVRDGELFDNYIIEGDMVYWDDDKVYISATPHTITKRSWVYFNVTSKVYTGDVNVILGFDTNKLWPLKAELYKPHNETYEDGYQCNGNFTYNSTYFWCYDGNGTVIREHYFDRGNISSKTAYWNVTVERDWISIAERFTKKSKDYGGMNTWYISDDLPIVQDKEYIMRVAIDVANKPDKFALEEVDSKYWFAIKRSSDSIQGAIDSDRLYALDPFVNSSGNDAGLDYLDSLDIRLWYNMDDNSTGELEEEVQGYNATMDTDLENVSGIIGGGQYFTAAQNDKATSWDVDSSELTVCAWVNATALTNYRGIVTKNRDTGFELGYTTDTTEWRWRTKADAAKQVGNDTVSLNEWYFLCGTFESSAVNTTIWVNGKIGESTSSTGALANNNDNITIGREHDGYSFEGVIDNVIMFGEDLNATAIADLYNNGLGVAYGNGTAPPDPDTEYPEFFDYWDDNASLIESGEGFFNVSVNMTNGTVVLEINGTNVTATNLTANVYNASYTFGINETYTYYWHSWGNGTSTNYNISNTRSYTVNESVDVINPDVSITYPTNTTYHVGLANLFSLNTTLNWTINDTSLSECWYSNGTDNTTVTCDLNTTGIQLGVGDNLITMYANDTTGNQNSSSVAISIIYDLLENYQTFNDTVYETESEMYIINISYVEDDWTNITADLVHLGTSYSGNHTVQGNSSLFDAFVTIPTGTYGNVSQFFWNFTLTNATGSYYYNSRTFNQSIVQRIFDLCNDTLNVSFINFSFADEGDDSTINASIPYSTFLYYLGDGSVNKTLTFVNNTEHFSYAFCSNIEDATLFLDYYLQYESTGYPQRTLDPEVIQVTNETTNRTLYLLATADGIYVTFQVVNPAEQPLANTYVTATRVADNVQVGDGTTGADGGVTFWLNPNFQHNFTFNRTGYDFYSTALTPTQSSYTITLGEEDTTNISDLGRGITYTILPVGYLVNDTSYEFNFTIDSTYWSLDNFGFNITNASEILLGSNSSTVDTGGMVSLDLDTGQNTSFIFNFYYTANGTLVTGTRIYVIVDDSYDSWSIRNLLDDFSSYMSTGIFGLTIEGVGILVFIIIFALAGGLTYKFGLTSPAAIMAFIFGLVVLFDVGLNLLPSPVGSVEHFPSIIMGIIFVSIFLREASK